MTASCAGHGWWVRGYVCWRKSPLNLSRRGRNSQSPRLIEELRTRNKAGYEVNKILKPSCGLRSTRLPYPDMVCGLYVLSHMSLAGSCQFFITQ